MPGWEPLTTLPTHVTQRPSHLLRPLCAHLGAAVMLGGVSWFLRTIHSHHPWGQCPSSMTRGPGLWALYPYSHCQAPEQPQGPGHWEGLGMKDIIQVRCVKWDPRVWDDCRWGQQRAHES